MNSETFATIMGALDSPLIVVTTAVDKERAGCLVGFHSQSSIEPERYCLWLSKANHTYRVALQSTHLGVHFLTQADLALAKLFGSQTGDEIDKFAGLNVTTGEGGVPVLEDCPHRLVVRRVALLDDNGDHICLSTQPVSAESNGSFEPLRVSHAKGLTAGHQNEERHSPPTERATR
jgi:flavin reductase (DIM6/NTAB) family NADH-FMN oxidoreductase RutF